MGLGKYFEDNYEMFLERVEGVRCTVMEYPISYKAVYVAPKVSIYRIKPHDMKFKCKDCGEVFTLTMGEQKFYHNHDLCFPKRCKSCRNQRRAKAC